MLVIGYIGPTLPRDLRKKWNALFAQRELDAFFDFYRTKQDDLPLRLSEMFLLERRGYLVDKAFSTKIIPLLDQLDESAKRSGMVDMITNQGGVLVGHWIGMNNEPVDDYWTAWVW